jgi:exonuclease VII small subunit
MVITEHFTVWLYFHDEQLSQTCYDKLSKSRQQIKIIKREKKEPLRDGCSD